MRLSFYVFLSLIFFYSCTPIKNFRESNSAPIYIIDPHENIASTAVLVYFSSSAIIVVSNNSYLNLENLHTYHSKFIQDSSLEREILSLKVLRYDTINGLFDTSNLIPIFDKLPSHVYFKFNRLFILVYAQNDKTLFETLKSIPNEERIKIIIDRKIRSFNKNYQSKLFGSH